MQVCPQDTIFFKLEKVRNSILKILILGINGFIGHHLARHILENTSWVVYGMDLTDDRVKHLRDFDNFFYTEGDITINKEWIKYHIKKCDVIMPLVAIATPSSYVNDPLGVFELDFEANLPIIRSSVEYKKRIIFPSTSEVYGKSKDTPFCPNTSDLVLGLINKQRWIYSCSNQLLDRIIYAYGEKNDLDYTLFRPFNWFGSGLDNINEPKEGGSRVITQFIGNISRGINLSLVDGGMQKRCFTDIEDGISALISILENKDGIASKKIYNIGNPKNDYSIKELANMIIDEAALHPHWDKLVKKIKIIDVSSNEYYGAGYQDVTNRVPNISALQRDLDWHPSVGMQAGLKKVFNFYTKNFKNAEQLLSL